MIDGRELHDLTLAVWTVGCVLAVCGVIIASIGTILHMQLPGQVAEIEQVRQDLAMLGADESEGSVALAVQWNAAIQSNRRYNAMWWSCLFVPNGWDDVELIVMPERGEKQ